MEEGKRLMKRTTREAILLQAAERLRDLGFDTVQILATTHNVEANVTQAYWKGVGNLFARQCNADAFIQAGRDQDLANAINGADTSADDDEEIEGSGENGEDEGDGDGAKAG
jgi:hypothetical protein